MKEALGEKAGVCAVWLQWINTMVWYPAILSFIAGSIAYLISPALATSPVYILSVILILFWTLTGINCLGVQTSARVNNICGLIGTIFPLLLLIGFGAYWLISGQPSQIQFFFGRNSSRAQNQCDMDLSCLCHGLFFGHGALQCACQ